MYVDVHCHLPESHFPDPVAVLDRAKKDAVVRVIVNGTSIEDNEKIFAIKHPILRYAFGLHPCDVQEGVDYKDTFVWIKKHAKHCVALGEIGLDGHWKPELLPIQLPVFRRLLELAVDLEKPVIIHSRKAEEQTLKEIEGISVPVVLHCFGGNKKLIEQGVKQGCYFSITSNVTRSDQVQKLVELVPLRQMLTETDSPYMSKQKDTNSESRDVVLSVAEIARIKKITEEECRNIIFQNYMRVFGD